MQRHLRVLAFAAATTLLACGARSGLRDPELVADVTGDDASTPADAPMPGQDITVMAPEPHAMLSVGLWHSCAVAVDGTVRCWGMNSVGQIGDGTTQNRAEPTPTQNLRDVVELVSGAQSTCARGRDGTVRCWGVLTNQGFRPPPLPPTVIAGVRDPVQLAAGGMTACALLRDGTASCWGIVAYGERRGGQCQSASVSTTAVPVRDLRDAVQLSVGESYACALVRDGSVRCWGCNGSNQLGAGTSPTGLTPVTVIGLSNIVEIAVGANHACALRADHAVLCWGSLINTDGRHETPPGAREIPGFHDAVHLSTGGENTCAILAGGTVECVGTNALTGGVDANCGGRWVHVPERVAGLASVRELVVASGHACARQTDRSVWCWGCNTFGQVGDGSLVPRRVPVRVIE